MKKLFLFLQIVLSLFLFSDEIHKISGYIEDINYSDFTIRIDNENYFFNMSQIKKIKIKDFVKVQFIINNNQKYIAKISKKSTLKNIFKPFIDFYMRNVNYYTITFFMIIESSFIPFPSEIVVPPAAYKAANMELNIYLVLFFSTLGALIGAIINYFLSLSLGRKIIYGFANSKIGHILLLNQESIEKAEEYFKKYGNISTFIGRLIPAIRQLISIPAGLSKMDFKKFLLWTSMGAFIWNLILTLLGYFFFTQKEILEKYYEELTYAGILLGLLLFIYIIYKIIKNK